jgi:hypothetical protein
MYYSTMILCGKYNRKVEAENFTINFCSNIFATGYKNIKNDWLY